MMGERTLYALCGACQDVVAHAVTDADPGSCACTVCGTVQQLMVPLA